MEQQALNKKAAAALLGVSERTLERLTGAGRITATYQKGGTRPSPRFAEADILALKTELDATRSPRPSRPVVAPSVAESVTFRIPEHYLAQLSDLAAQHGMSAGMYARHVVIDALEAGEQVRLVEMLIELQRLVRVVGEDLASSVLVLLLHAGSVTTEAEARSWVQENLKAYRTL